MIHARVAVLVSGQGTNLQVLLDAAAANTLGGGQISLVASDRRAARGLERARAAGVASAWIPVRPTREPGYDNLLIEALERAAPDLIVLAGYMRILSAELLSRFHGRVINLHPALLPRHKGLDTHRRVLASGDSEHGASVHFVTPGLDEGPCILQYVLPVRRADTEHSLAARVHAGEYLILPRAVEWYCEERLRLVDDAVMLDGRRLAQPVRIPEEPTDSDAN